MRTMYFWFIDDISLAVKPKYVISHTASSTRFHLVFMSE
jgi:hypothetical protein